MKKEFIVERQGKSFVLYAGLLDEAHSNQGLKSIRTKLVQAPASDNGFVAIVLAEVETSRGVFTGIGDASPDNVTRMLAPHYIRMAETRAKARALRDAVNVGVTALEELGEMDHDNATGTDDNRSFREATGVSFDDDRRRTPQPPPPGANWAPATPAQLKAIYVIARNEQHLSDEETDDRSRRQYGRPANELSKREAAEFIDQLKQPVPSRQPHATPIADRLAAMPSPTIDEIGKAKPGDRIVPKDDILWTDPTNGILARADKAMALGIDMKVLLAELGIAKWAGGLTVKQCDDLRFRLAKEIEQREQLIPQPV